MAKYNILTKGNKMSNVNKIDCDDLTKKIFDEMWNGKRVWDALLNMEEERHISPSKAINCVSHCGIWGKSKYEMDWKKADLKVVLKTFLRPAFGILDFLFGSAKDKCYHKAIKWLDKACDEEQFLLFTVIFMVGDMPITGGERNKRLVEKFIKYIDSIKPEVTSEDANIVADKVLQED